MSTKYDDMDADELMEAVTFAAENVANDPEEYAAIVAFLNAGGIQVTRTAYDKLTLSVALDS